MAHFQVYWRAGKDGPPLASHWYTLGGVVVWASPALIDWVGKRHADLVRELQVGIAGCWGVDDKPRTPEWLDDHCVPPTQKYHKQLMQCIAALVEEVPLKNPPCMTLTELARLKGTTVSALQKRARKVPFPATTVFKPKPFKMGRLSLIQKANQYPRAALLEWFDKTSEVQHATVE